MPLFIFEAILITSALSVDTFVASFAYGSNKIKIPILSISIITIICSFVLVSSLLLGTLVSEFIPIWLTAALSFIILFSLGVFKLIDSIIKSKIKKNKSFTTQNKNSILNLKFILSLYTNPENADIDQSRFISPMEATILAFALSLDGFAVGFGAALGDTSIITILIASLVIGFVAIVTGSYLGNKVSTKLKSDLSWLSGVILIVLAFLSLMWKFIRKDEFF